MFVDGGAYIGDTAEGFLKFCNGKYEKMHLFELDPGIYKKLNLNLTNLGGGRIAVIHTVFRMKMER